MPNETKEITALFLDIGGVILTNGWGTDFRLKAIEHFGLEKDEVESRHQLAFDNYELGVYDLDTYLEMVVFYKPRHFTKSAFRQYMLELSAALPGHLEFFIDLKHKYHLKVFAVSNEGAEINEYRIKKFKLNDLFDGYISSCYVGMHKPGRPILQLACNIAQVAPEHALYVDDRPLLADVGRAFGLQTLQFQGLDHAKEFINNCTFHQ